MSTPRFHYNERSLATNMSLPSFQQQKRKKSRITGLCMKRQHSQSLGSGVKREEGWDACPKVYSGATEDGALEAGFHFESYPRSMIGNTQEKLLTA